MSATPANAARMQVGSSRQVPVTLPAAVVINGQVTPSELAITQSGTFFYVLSCSSPVLIQPVRAGAVGATNLFGIAQGQPVADGFDTLKIANRNPFPVVALIWVGYDSFVNNQFILTTGVSENVAYPTYPVASVAASVAIPDKSGTFFFDINGKKWGALNRVAILVFNTDNGVSLIMHKAGASTAGAPGIGAIFPQTAIRFDCGGDYSLSTGGGNINAIVSEIYQAIPL